MDETLTKLLKRGPVYAASRMSQGAEIVQCGEPILLENFTTRSRLPALCDAVCDITLFAL